jgi:hypothetical protein
MLQHFCCMHVPLQLQLYFASASCGTLFSFSENNIHDSLEEICILLVASVNRRSGELRQEWWFPPPYQEIGGRLHT